MAPSPAPAATSRPVLIALILLAAAVVAILAGLLSVAGGTRLPLAILYGGAAFGGATGLLLALVRYATGNSS